MTGKTNAFYAPCPVLDLEAMQTWLEDMALDGYLLKGWDRGRHRFAFYSIEPLPTRYRLIPVSDPIEAWNVRPEEGFVSIMETFGWEYVCSNDSVHIFRTYDEDAREIHTDPAIQTQQIRQMGWRILKTALIWLAIPLVYLLVVYVFGGRDHFWQSLLLDSAGIQIILAYFVAIAVVRSAGELRQLCPLYKRLKQGDAPIKRKDWKKKAPAYRMAFRIYPVLLALLALAVVIGRAAYWDAAAYQPLPPVGTELPFASVADMAKDSDVRSAERMDDVNDMRNWSHILSPVNFDWSEIVEVVDRDGNEGLVSLRVRYYEPRFAWLAECLTEECLSYARKTGTEMTEKPATKADLAYFYSDEYGDPAAVLRYGHCVVCVTFSRMDFDDPSLGFAHWVEVCDKTLS